jgi:hypothetical protein
MCAARIVIISVLVQLLRQVQGVPEEYAVKIFSVQGADQPFDGWVRNGCIRNGFDLCDFEYPQVGEPMVEAKEGIVVGTQVFRKRLAGDGAILARSTPKPTSRRAKTSITTITQRLLNLSVRRNEDSNLTLTRYALERLLYRLAHSEYAGQFILKGAMLFLTVHVRSPETLMRTQ